MPVGNGYRYWQRSDLLVGRWLRICLGLKKDRCSCDCQPHWALALVVYPIAEETLITLVVMLFEVVVGLL